MQRERFFRTVNWHISQMLRMIRNFRSFNWFLSVFLRLYASLRGTTFSYWTPCSIRNNGMQFMRNCYCNRSIPVDKPYLKRIRDDFFGVYRWWYDPSRGISRNHQNTGNYDVKYKSADHLNESSKWTAISGKLSPAILSSEVLSPATATTLPPISSSSNGMMSD